MIILYTLLIIFLIIIFLFSLILFLDFSVILSTEGKNIKLFIKTMGIKFKIPLDAKPKKKIPKKEKQKTEKPKSEDDVMKKLFDMRNNFTRQKKAIGKAISYIRYKISIDKVGAIGELGTGNAATTGIAYGAIMAFVNTVFGFLGQFFSLKESPDLSIKTNYDKAVFDLNFVFMIRTKIWYLLKAFLIYKKSVKEQ